MELVALLFSPSLRVFDKEYLSPRIAGLASDAAVIALLDGRDHINAINLLELGREVLIGSIYELRAELHEPHLEHPHLAKSLAKLRRQLVKVHKERETMAAEAMLDNHQFATDELHEASRQIMLLIKEIRQQPRFERFLLPPPKKEMLDVASKGPVVIVTISSYRCDAFSIDKSGIHLLGLPNLLLSDVTIRSKDIESLENLQ